MQKTRVHFCSVSLLVIAVLVGSACAPKTDQESAEPTVPPVPQEYQSLYKELDDELSAFELVLKQKWDGSRNDTTFATELSFANGNIGEGLLRPETLENNRILLDFLQNMGIQGVVLSIKYPLLEPTFPRSTEYLSFYKQIATEIRRHDMKVLVETGAVFAGTAFSSVPVDWSKYTSASFLEGMQDQLVLIAHEIKPDYLTLTEEPGTQEMLTKLHFTLTDWTNFIETTLKRLDRTGGMLVGAGMGSWDDAAYVTAFLGINGIDYLDMHIYPPGDDGMFLERALNTALQVKAAGKRFTVGESWLYKATLVEITSSPAVNEAAFNRDTYSFWYPLDARFIEDIMGMADTGKMDFVSFFWMRNFLAYLDYSTATKDMSPAELNRLINQTVLSNLKLGVLSPLGQFYQERLQSRNTP
jgi:hypothetical protein